MPYKLKSKRTNVTQLAAKEAPIQRAVMRELFALEALGVPIAAAHVANESPRSPRHGAELKRQGLRPGVPDVVVWLPAQRVLNIELKRKGGKLTEAQAAFRDRLLELGHSFEVVDEPTPHLACERVRALVREQLPEHLRGLVR